MQKFQGRKTKFAFPLYTVETETKFRLRSHCIQGKRTFRFSSLKNSKKSWFSNGFLFDFGEKSDVFQPSFYNISAIS
jgi:hypothetical protein